MSTIIFDEAIKEFMGRLSDNYNLGEEGNEWVIENLQDVLYPLANQLSSEPSAEASEPSAEASEPSGDDIKGLLQQLIQMQGTQVAPQASSPTKKRGTTGWMQFVKHMKEKEPDEKHNFESCSPLWKAMSDEEKEEFNQKAKDINAEAASSAPAVQQGTTQKKPNAWNQFCKEWKIKCDQEGTKYNVKEASAAYQKLKAQLANQ